MQKEIKLKKTCKLLKYRKHSSFEPKFQMEDNISDVQMDLDNMEISEEAENNFVMDPLIFHFIYVYVSNAILELQGTEAHLFFMLHR